MHHFVATPKSILNWITNQDIILSQLFCWIGSWCGRSRGDWEKTKSAVIVGVEFAVCTGSHVKHRKKRNRNTERPTIANNTTRTQTLLETSLLWSRSRLPCSNCGGVMMSTYLKHLIGHFELVSVDIETWPIKIWRCFHRFFAILLTVFDQKINKKSSVHSKRPRGPTRKNRNSGSM